MFKCSEIETETVSEGSMDVQVVSLIIKRPPMQAATTSATGVPNTKCFKKVRFIAVKWDTHSNVCSFLIQHYVSSQNSAENSSHGVGATQKMKLEASSSVQDDDFLIRARAYETQLQVEAEEERRTNILMG